MQHHPRSSPTSPQGSLAQACQPSQAELRSKLSVAAQLKAIGQSPHPLGLSGIKTRSGCGRGKTQGIAQKIIHNYEQVILSLSGDSRKHAAAVEGSPEADRHEQRYGEANVKEFGAPFADDLIGDQGEKLVNSVSLTVKGREGNDKDI